MTTTLHTQHFSGLGELFHVGFAVADLDQSIKRWSLLGVTDWHSTKVLPYTAMFKGKQTQFQLRMAFGSTADGMALELAQPIEGNWTASEWLRQHGDSPYHLGFWVDNPSAVAGQFQARGIAVETIDSDSNNARFAYLDVRDTLGVYAEIVRRGIPWGRDL